jgi:NAD-dependent deacetylase
LDVYLADPAVRRRAWLNRRDNPVWHAQPNPAHRALVDLERAGRLRAIVTQNIDGLHQRAGSDADKVIEIHGTLSEVECLSCGDRGPMRDALDRVAAGEPDPACLACGGILKSATISFGQSLNPVLLRHAIAASEDCDTFLAVGSSLTVHPAAGLVDIAVHAGARVMIINAEPTPYDRLAGARISEPIGAALPTILTGLTGR